MVEDNVLEKRFWKVAEHEAAQRSIKITPDGADFLKSFINEGVSKLMAEDNVNDQNIELAETNLIKFVTRTSALSIELGENTKGFVLPELSKRTVMQTILSICPCWPFC